MKKIRLTESTLRRVIRESVKKIVNEEIDKSTEMVSLQDVCDILDMMGVGHYEFMDEYKEYMGRKEYMNGDYDDNDPLFDEYPEDDPYDPDNKDFQTFDDWNSIRKQDDEAERKLSLSRLTGAGQNLNLGKSKGALSMDALEDPEGYGASFHGTENGVVGGGDINKEFQYIQKMRNKRAQSK